MGRKPKLRMRIAAWYLRWRLPRWEVGLDRAEGHLRNVEDAQAKGGDFGHLLLSAQKHVDRCRDRIEKARESLRLAELDGA